VKTGERLSFDDGVALFNTTDLNALQTRRHCAAARHGRTTYFNVKSPFHPTNVCYVDCKFCAFLSHAAPAGAYTTHRRFLRIAGQAVNEGATSCTPLAG